MNDTNQMREIRRYLMIAIVIAILSLISSVLKNVINERWAKQRNNVACIPADIQQEFPLVYHQTAINPVQNDALMKSFVMEYIQITQNEQIVDYHARTEGGARYQNIRLKDNLKKAIEMSLDNEKALNIIRFANSNDTYQRLKKDNMGWVFLVDDILLFNGPQAHGGMMMINRAGYGSTLAVIRGQFQVTYDQAIANKVPSEFWGYKEIHLLIQQGVPTYDVNEKPINTYGLFVTWSNIEDLDSVRKSLFSERNYNYYMKKEQ